MDRPQQIQSVESWFSGRQVDLPESPGIYAFWWIGDKTRLMGANRQIVLKGPGGRDVEVEYRDWWPKELAFPCLYVGKTTNIKKRFSLHIKRRCSGRLHAAARNHRKERPATTSCQIRFGVEHIFPREQDPLYVIFTQVGFSYRADFEDNAIAERFFEEDRLIGHWRPWFNIDSER